MLWPGCFFPEASLGDPLSMVLQHGAKALCLEDSLGSFDVGKDADFIVLNPRSTPLMAFRNSADVPTSLSELADRTFSLVMMGDDRAIADVWVAGRPKGDGN